MGVGNQISVFDMLIKEVFQVVFEIEFSCVEDSVNIIVVGLCKKNLVLVYVGINLSEDDIKKGKNEYFRVFFVDLLLKIKVVVGGLKIIEVLRFLFFMIKDIEVYQRVLRILQLYEGVKQIGVVVMGVYWVVKDL